MRRFTALYHQLDATTSTNEKVGALKRYFADAPPEDAAWALRVLTGGRFKRTVTGTQLRAWASEATGIPQWLVAECRDAVGDLSETIALLLPEPDHPEPMPLHELAEHNLLPMRALDDDEKRAALRALWDRFTARERLVLHKLLSGSFRVGAGRTLVVRALAQHAGVEQAVMQHRLSGTFEPTADAFRALCDPASSDADTSARPYPFFLASPAEGDADAIEQSLGSPADWHIELKWDGIRAQLIRRGGDTLLWSRGEDMIARPFPEIAEIGDHLPDGTVLDGELLAWDAARPIADNASIELPKTINDIQGSPLPFAALQRRLNRKDYQPTLFDDVPVRFVAYDLLESGGDDVRTEPIERRRSLLDEVINDLPGHLPCALSASFNVCHWSRAQEIKDHARELKAEGVMLKRAGSAYGTGRTRGDWFKWKADPFSIDAVLIAAQHGSGRRASLFTDYSFGIWDESVDPRALVPIAKAYSGLTDHEINRVDHFVRTHITGRSGPVRHVEPRLVFELGFEGIAESSRHKSGIALRFPRMLRWREDKDPSDADTLETVRAMLRAYGTVGP